MTNLDPALSIVNYEGENYAGTIMGIGSLSKLYVFNKPPFQLRVTSTFLLSNWATGACLEIYVNYILWGRLWMDEGLKSSGFNFTE